MRENSHDGDSTPASGPDETPDDHAWIAPLISSVVTVPSGLLALVYGALSPMECGSCNGAVADRFHDSYMTAWTVLCIGLVLALIVLIATWAVPTSSATPPGAWAWPSPPPPSSGSLS